MVDHVAVALAGRAVGSLCWPRDRVLAIVCGDPSTAVKGRILKKKLLSLYMLLKIVTWQGAILNLACNPLFRLHTFLALLAEAARLR